MNFLNRYPKVDIFDPPSNIEDNFSLVDWNALRTESHYIIQNIRENIFPVSTGRLFPFLPHTHEFGSNRFSIGF